MDPMSGLTSQPCLGSLVEALRHTERDTGLDPDAIRRLSFYWEAVRGQYVAFESDLNAGASEVYLHEMPGGQFTNLREQARALGLESRWHEVARAYRDVNDMFGDIVKVTPSSKVVGDMALMMVSQNLTAANVLDPAKEIAFPQSVVEMFHGDLGQPPGGWPAALQSKILKDKTAITARPGALLPPADIEAIRAEAAQKCGIDMHDQILSSYLMYPDVFTKFNASIRTYGPVATLPTPVYFYGMKPGDEIPVTIQEGKTLIIRLQTIGETDDDGNVRVFFELNGQPRVIVVPNRLVAATRPARRKADDADPKQVGAPMPGSISAILVREDQTVTQGEPLLAIEAMKMEAQITAPRDGTVKTILVRIGEQLDAKDLLLEFA
jgi:pyruvate carboxylase